MCAFFIGLQVSKSIAVPPLKGFQDHCLKVLHNLVCSLYFSKFYQFVVIVFLSKLNAAQHICHSWQAEQHQLIYI